MFILYSGDYEALLWVLITWPKCNPQSWNCLWVISHSDSSLNAKCQQCCHFCRADEKKLVAGFNEFLGHILEILQFYYALKLEVVVGKKVDSRKQRAVFPGPGKILCDFIHRVCLGFCLLFLKMQKGLASCFVTCNECKVHIIPTPVFPHLLYLMSFRENHCSPPLTCCSFGLNLTD